MVDNLIGAKVALLFLFVSNSVDGLNILEFADNITTVGVLLWIAYTQKKAMEKMSANFQKEEREIRQEFKQELEKIALVHERIATNLIGKLEKKDKEFLDFFKRNGA